MAPNGVVSLGEECPERPTLTSTAHDLTDRQPQAEPDSFPKPTAYEPFSPDAPVSRQTSSRASPRSSRASPRSCAVRGSPRSSSKASSAVQSSMAQSVQEESSQARAWLADALSAERLAITKELEKRHSSLLLKFDWQAMSITPAASPVGKDSGARKEVEEEQQISPSAIILSNEPEEPKPRLKLARSHTCCIKDSTASSLADELRMCEERDQKELLQMPNFQSMRSVERKSQFYDDYQSSKGAKSVFLGLRFMIMSDTFEIVLAVCIILNALTIAAKAQYESFEVAHKIKFPGASSDPEDVWPGARSIFEAIELFFGIVFLLEVVCKAGVGPLRFVKQKWNCFDLAIVSFWAFGIMGIELIMNPTLLRLIRLVRLLRLLRLVKTIHMFDILHVLIGSLKASMSVLIWSMVVILGIILGASLTFNFVLEVYILDESKPLEMRQKVYERFGSFSRAVVTMFEMTLGSWIVPLRLLQENVNEWYGPVLLVYLIVVNFAVMQVIRAVFMQQTFKVAASDEDLMVMQKERQMKRYSEDMKRFFLDADTSGDGYVCFDEFMDMAGDPRVRTWLSAMEFDATNTAHVFDMLERDGDGKLSAEELVHGVDRLRGPARSVDVLTLEQRFIGLEDMCRKIESYLRIENRKTSRTADKFATYS